MTYMRLLLLFVLVPTLVLSIAIWCDRTWRRHSVDQAPFWPRVAALVILMGVATLYTIPWDDHLIALGVWWYKPTLVLGMHLGHIPVEEVLFFPLQTLLVGLWWIWLSGHLPSVSGVRTHAQGSNHRGAGHVVALGVAGAVVWIGALSLLKWGWRPGTYLGWEIVWALPPLLFQIIIGGDILWRHRRFVIGVAVPVALYLSGVDTLAIHLGIWTINPHQSLGVDFGGWLPIEEFLFFSLTSMLVSFGLELAVVSELRSRIRGTFDRWQSHPGRSDTRDQRRRAHGPA